MALDLCEVCHLMWSQGWVAANDGNVSVRRDDGTIVCTPSGVSKREITIWQVSFFGECGPCTA